VTLNKYVYGYADPVNIVDPSGHFGFSVGGMMSGLNAGLRLASANIGSIARFTVGGSKGKQSIVKYIGCQIGTAYLKREYSNDRVEGHHAIPKNLGGNPDQDLIYLPANTHRMFHWVLHVMLKNDPELQGMGNWTSKQNWDKISQSKAGRTILYNHILAASRVVDKFCRLKPPSSLQYFVRKNRKEFIGE
jgi:hypothetical protein